MKIIDNNNNEIEVKDGDTFIIKSQSMEKVADGRTLVSFFVKTEDLADIVAGHCQDRGYQAKITEIDATTGKSIQIDNPLTPEQFTLQCISDLGTAPANRIRRQRAEKEALAKLSVKTLDNALKNE